MQEFVRCPVCRGQKIVCGAGMIYHDCTNCKKIGWVELKEEVKAEPESPKKKKKSDVQ